MANELSALYPQTGMASSIYFLLDDSTSRAYRTDTKVFEAYNSANYASYMIASSELGAKRKYVANMPTSANGVPLGTYSVTALIGSSPGVGAEGDTQIGEGVIYWSGSAVLIPGTISGPVTLDSLLVTGGTTFTNTNGDGFTCSGGGAFGSGVNFIGALNGGYGMFLQGGNAFGAAFNMTTTSGDCISCVPDGLHKAIALTGGTSGINNVALASGQLPANFLLLGIDGSGNLTGSIASVVGSVGSVTAPVTVGTNNDKTGYALTQAFPANFSSTSIDSSGHVKIQTNEVTNTALSSFQFLMQRASNGNPMTGLGGTIVAQRVIDNGTPAACVNTPSEVGSGLYKIDLPAADRNGKVVTYIFSAAQAATRYITMVMTP